MVRNFGVPVNVLPLVRLGRYTALLAGMAYGVYRHGVLQNYEDKRRAAQWQRDTTVYRPPPSTASPMPGRTTTFPPDNDKKDGTAISLPTDGTFGPGNTTYPEIDWISILPVTGKESTITEVSTSPDDDNKDGTIIPFPTEGIVNPGDTTVSGAKIDRIEIPPVTGKETTVSGVSASPADEKMTTSGHPV